MRSCKVQQSLDGYADLRRRVEEVVEFQRTRQADCPTADICSVVHDLHASHLELEKQEEELRRACMELQAIRDKYTDLYDFAPVAYLTLDEAGSVREINLAGAALFGLSKPKIIGKRLANFIAQVDRRTFHGFQKAIRNSSQALTCEMQVMSNNEACVFVRVESLALRSKTGKFIGSRTIIHDITERKRAEDALFREKERAQITLQSIGDAVITTTDEGIVDFLNPMAETLTGWSVDRAVGQPLKVVFQVVDELTGRPLPDPVGRCLRQGRIVGLSNHSLLVSNSGREYAIQDSAAPIRDKQGRIVGAVLVFQDVTEARKLARQMAHHANHDPLTGLVNRRAFEKRLERAFASAKLHDAEHALCYLDLDGFKVVNDTAGHIAGDELLKQVASVLSRHGRARDTLARIGGDEFCLLIENCPLDKALKISEHMVTAVHNYRFVWEKRSFSIGASIGLIEINQSSESVRQILTEADVACYRAKDLGRNRVHLHHKFDCTTGDSRMSLVQIKDLHEAIDNERFRLFCQPIRALKNNSSAGALHEVLIRLRDEQGALILPNAFIPIAERYGVMPAIDRWVIRDAFKQTAGVLGKGANMSLAINLSGHTINDESLLEFIVSELADAYFPANRLCFEITETAAIRNFSQAAELIDALRRRGCRFALDDFGKGVSSMSYLKHLSVDYLKIDGGFVMNMAENKIDQAMVAAMNEMAHALGIETIAECAESTDVVEHLARIGVDYVQGFSIGRPAPIETLVTTANPKFERTAQMH